MCPRWLFEQDPLMPLQEDIRDSYGNRHPQVSGIVVVEFPLYKKNSRPKYAPSPWRYAQPFAKLFSAQSLLCSLMSLRRHLKVVILLYKVSRKIKGVCKICHKFTLQNWLFLKLYNFRLGELNLKCSPILVTFGDIISRRRIPSFKSNTLYIMVFLCIVYFQKV